MFNFFNKAEERYLHDPYLNEFADYLRNIEDFLIAVKTLFNIIGDEMVGNAMEWYDNKENNDDIIEDLVFIIIMKFKCIKFKENIKERIKQRLPLPSPKEYDTSKLIIGREVMVKITQKYMDFLDNSIDKMRKDIEKHQKEQEELKKAENNEEKEGIEGENDHKVYVVGKNGEESIILNEENYKNFVKENGENDEFISYNDALQHILNKK